jgi:toluene monooxygenase system ferredoxin subunit
MSFRRAASLSQLWVGELTGVVVEDTKVLLVRLDDGVRAFEDRCAHKGVALSEGQLAGTTLTCKAHAWRYDAKTGHGMDPANVCLRRFAVKVEGDDVLVDVQTPAALPTSTSSEGTDEVGPVLQSGPLTDAVVGAILAENSAARVVDRGAYVRVLCPGACVVTRAAIEARAGAAFRLPRDLELLMSSFKGRFRVTEDEARWEVRWRA